jgi:hypothetical protein
MLNLGTGEIAAFDGRLPFYSFTVHNGVTYVRGTTVKLEITYRPNGLSAASPATVEYKLTSGANTYSSGPLNFDQGNAPRIRRTVCGEPSSRTTRAGTSSRTSRAAPET